MNTIEVLDEQVETLKREERELEKLRDEELMEVIEANFGDILQDDMDITGGPSSYSFNRDHEDLNYRKGVCDVSFKEKWFERDSENNFEPRGMKVSCYSSNTDCDWDLERIIICGQIAAVVLDKQDDIINQFNVIWNKYKDQIHEVYSKRWELEKSIDTLKQADEDQQVGKLLKAFYSGKEIVVEELKGTDLTKGKLRLPAMTMGWNLSAVNVKSFKITRLSSSLKTCDIELTSNFVNTTYPIISSDDDSYDRHDYNNPIYDVKVLIYTYDRVKVSYIEKFIRSYVNHLLVADTVAS